MHKPVDLVEFVNANPPGWYREIIEGIGKAET